MNRMMGGIFCLLLLLVSEVRGENLIENADFRKGTSGLQNSNAAEMISDADRQAGKGDLLLKNGSVGFRVMWRKQESGVYRCKVRFRNIEKSNGAGLMVVVQDRDGTILKIAAQEKRINEDIVCTAMVPISREVKSLWIALSGRKDGKPVALDQLSLEPEPNARETRIPPVPKLTVQSWLPFQVEATFNNHQYASRGAQLERSVDGGEFTVVAESASYCHRLMDPKAIPGSRSVYRLRLRSDGGMSEYSDEKALTVPAWTRSAGNSIYYIDATSGNDANSGLSPEQAWKSLARAICQIYGNGDRLLFHRGGIWTGKLDLHGGGSAEAPVQVGSYGEGPRPRIDGNGLFAIRIRNSSHWEISGLELTNRQPMSDEVRKKLKPGDIFLPVYNRSQRKIGLMLELENFGEAENIVIRDLHIHDVDGRQQDKANGGIKVRIDGWQKPSRYRKLVIENNRLNNVCRSGIVFRVFPHAYRKDWYPSTDVKIIGNRLYDIGGDGIVPWASDGALIANNEVWRSSCTAREANAGIWPWSCDNTLITGNLVADTAKHANNVDGQGYDVDTNNYNTIVENNLSLRNKGGFILICGERTPVSDWSNRRAIIRNNISIADGSKWGGIISFAKTLDDISIYNNTFLIPQSSTCLFFFTDWQRGRHPDQMKGIRFYHNLIYTDRDLMHLNAHDDWDIHHNLFWGSGAQELSQVGYSNRLADPRFSGEIDLSADIPSQLEKLRPSFTHGTAVGNSKLDRDYFGEVSPGTWCGALAPKQQQ